MKSLLSIALLAMLIVAGATIGLAADAVAFVDVTVIPMDRERTLPRHTVIVRGDRITEVGPAGSVQIPAGALTIDGTGKFLMPGFGEMHGHNPALGSPAEFFEEVFFLYVANGVTTVRSMQGFAGQLEWREKARGTEITAPTLYLAGPSFSGHTVPSPQSAIDRVRAQKDEDWDLLKIHPGIKPIVYTSLAETARELDIEFSGHVPAEVGLIRCIEQGQRTVDHLDGYIEHLDARDTPIDAAKLEQIVTFTRESGAWVVPTMVLWETIIGAADPGAIEALPELKYLPGDMVRNWKNSYAQRTSSPQFRPERARQIAANRKVLLKALADGGVRILFGTDSPQEFSVPGFSIHREMQAMKAVGMSNFAILQSGTSRVGEYLSAKDQFGTVAAGQRADLVLLTANPLEDLVHFDRRAGVMSHGQWITEEKIQQRLAQIAAKYAW